MTRCSPELVQITGWESGTGFPTILLTSNLAKSGAHVCGGATAQPVCGTFLSLFGVCVQLEIFKMLPEEVAERRFSNSVDLGLKQAKHWPQVTQQDDGPLRGSHGNTVPRALL